MPADYHALYLRLFNAQTDAIQALDAAIEMLKKAHQDAELAVMDAPDTVLTVLTPPDKTDKEGD